MITKLEKILSKISFFPKRLNKNIRVLRKGKIKDTLKNRSIAIIDNKLLSDLILIISQDSFSPKKLIPDNMTRLYNKNFSFI
jgi:hypothetical protein